MATAPGPAPSEIPAARSARSNPNLVSSIVRIVAACVMLGVLIYVIVGPERYYGRETRVLLFFLAGLSLAMMTGAELANQIKLKVAGLAITLVGSAAVAISAVYFLNQMAAPEEVVVALDIVEADGSPVALQPDMVSIKPGQGAGMLTTAITGNTVFVVMPSTVGTMDVSLKYIGGGRYSIENLARPPHNRVLLKQSGADAQKGALDVVVRK